jgi:WD40 repeat protein
MNSDGTNQTRVTFNTVDDIDPVWSPDGSKLAFARQENSQTDLYTINVNGTGETNITTSPSISEQSPDWQPLSPAPNGYARPRGASPLNVRFVPAFNQCVGSSPPGSIHGSPLAVPSCQPSQQSSLFLTMGAGDSNGEASQFEGLLQIKAICNPPAPGPTPSCKNPGDQADVKLDAVFTDVRTAPDLTAYLGELEVRVFLRMTDRHNGTSDSVPATATDVPFRFAVPCSGELDTTIGSTCTVSTTADGVVPGIVPEGKRSVWELGQVQVYDGGADGVAATPDNTLFAVQGFFAP